MFNNHSTNNNNSSLSNGGGSPMVNNGGSASDEGGGGNIQQEPQQQDIGMMVLMHLYALEQQMINEKTVAEQQLTHSQGTQQNHQMFQQQDGQGLNLDDHVIVDEEKGVKKQRNVMRIILSEKSGISQCEYIPVQQHEHIINTHELRDVSPKKSFPQHDAKITKPSKMQQTMNVSTCEMTRVRSVSSTSSSSSSSTSAQKVENNTQHDNENGIKLSVHTLESYRDEMNKNKNRPKRGRGRPRKHVSD